MPHSHCLPPCLHSSVVSWIIMVADVGEMQVVLILCSHAATLLVNAALWPFSLYKAWVDFPQYIKYVEGKRIGCWGGTSLCFLSATGFSWCLPSLHCLGAQRSHVTLAVLSSAFPHHILPTSHPTGWNGFGKAREGLGTAGRSLLTWPEVCCGLALGTVWQIRETPHGDSVPTQKMCWGR